MTQSEIIMKLQEEVEKGNNNALHQFWEMVETKGTPLVETIRDDDENVLITFIWKGTPELESVGIDGSFLQGDASKNQLQRLHNTNVWYKSYVAKNNVLSSYFFSLNDNYGDNWEERWRNFENDPYNSKAFIFPKNEEIPNDVTKVASVIELPLSVPQPWVKEINNVNKGKVIESRFSSNLLKNKRRIWIYTPHGYDKSINYPLVLIFDGDMYTGAIPTPTILDNLISNKRIPPVVAVLVDNPQQERDTELPCNEVFVDFLTNELLPWIKRDYSVTTDPSKVVVAGSSYGGLAATFAGYKRPDIFGNVLSQSGSFWWKPNEKFEGHWLVKQFDKVPRLDLKFYMEVGIYETNLMLDPNREMVKVLEEKGYSIDYNEFSGGHDYLCWRGTLATGLISLLGKGSW